MGLVDGFTIWSNARATFGEGRPEDGSQFDASAQLRELQGRVQSAAPGSQWTGAGADAYADANDKQARTLGALAELDRRLGSEVDRSAEVVAAGRRDLDSVRQWVSDAAATVPDNAAGERMLIPVVGKGAGEIVSILERSNGDLAAIASRIRSLGEEYRALGDDRRDQAGRDDPAIQTVNNRLDEPESPAISIDSLPPTTPPAGRWSGPAPAGEVPGTGYWAVDLAHPSDAAAPLPTPPPYRSGPPCTANDATGPTSGVMTVGGDSPLKNDALGFDLQNTYRFRISGTEFTGETKMVQIEGTWYQAQWQSYQYEMNKIPVVQGSGDLGALTLPIMSEANDWEPVTIDRIQFESTKYPTGTMYLPDGAGGSIPVVGGAFRTSTPVIPEMHSGG